MANFSSPPETPEKEGEGVPEKRGGRPRKHLQFEKRKPAGR